MQNRARSSYAEPQPLFAVHFIVLQIYKKHLKPPNNFKE